MFVNTRSIKRKSKTNVTHPYFASKHSPPTAPFQLSFHFPNQILPSPFETDYNSLPAFLHYTVLRKFIDLWIFLTWFSAIPICAEN